MHSVSDQDHMKESRDITIYDVAKALNLSPSTVSRGLKNHPHIKKETRGRIISMAREMGYQHNKFASNLRRKRTNTIGVIVPRLNSYFMASMLAGVERIASETGYGLIINQSSESGAKEAFCVSTMFNSRVDGILISLASDTGSLDHFNILFKKDIPVIFFDRVADHNNCMKIVIDNYKAGFEAVTHLIEQGCKRIMHLGGNNLRNVYQERFNGYKDALKDHGIEYDPTLVMISDLSNQAGKEAARNILEMKDPPDAVFAANDTTAVALIVELEKAGIRIPVDIAVAGFNNEPVSQVVRPNLTTVDYPAMEMGEIAATSLIDKLKNPEPANLSTIILKHRLIIRRSSMRGNDIP